MFVQIVTIIFIFLTGVSSLKVSIHGIPDVITNGDPLWLNCTFDKEGEGSELYSIKWYKNGVEFYRYLPRDRPQSQVFPRLGLQYINLDKSDKGNVYLDKTDLNSTGEYRCEVSLEAPSFTTAEESKVIKVVEKSSKKGLKFDVPDEITKGDPVLLKCEGDLEEELYSIKWYKENKEFYRYYPKDEPQKQLFQMSGIYVDLAKSNAGNVYLSQTDENSVGEYRCEVSFEAPIFRTVYQIKVMSFSVENIKQHGLGDPRSFEPKIIVPGYILNRNPTLSLPLRNLPHNVVEFGRPMWLNCTSQRSDIKLYSIAWYKDNIEIYRYTPESSPKERKFEVPGVYIKQTDIGNILVGNATFFVQGSYRCEVTADAPYFSTSYAEKKIQFVSKFFTTISGANLVYAVGDKVNVNCETGPTVQRVPLKWYINEQEAPEDHLKGIVTFDMNGNIQNNALELSFDVEPEHFHKGKMALQCKGNLFEDTFVASQTTAVKTYVKHPDIFGPYVTSGNEMELPCDTTALGGEPVLIIWYKDDQMVPLYVVDMRKNGKDRFLPNEVIEGRATVDATSNPAVLKINNLVDDDTGAYSCRVHFKAFRSRQSVMWAEVLGSA